MVHKYERHIVNAIESRKSLLVQSHSLLILIEPYLFGMVGNYQYVLFGFQTNGEGRGYEPAWVSLPLSEINNIYPTGRKFYYDHEGYEANKPELQMVLCASNELEKAV
ncbi:MAG: hypothetical protein J7502_09810 [Flavisolibacter sp.]|nr:hypothetical protein [Flavisolibacter sp.]